MDLRSNLETGTPKAKEENLRAEIGTLREKGESLRDEIGILKEKGEQSRVVIGIMMEKVVEAVGNWRRCESIWSGWRRR